MTLRQLFGCFTWLSLAGVAWTSCGTHVKPLHQEVNPWIGTGGHGHTYPGATSPFGMVQLSPDTRLEGWDGCGGYHDTDSVIYGFSHTHLQGTGVSDYGDVLVMPCTQFRQGDQWRDKYKSGFRKSTEQGHAGYYAVTLDDHAIRAELTTTPRVGVHRYRLETPDTLTWIVDLEHRDDLIHYSIEPRGSRMLVGHRVSKNWAEEQHVYFAMQFDQDFDWGDQLGVISKSDTLADGTLAQEMTMVPVFVADFGVVSELNVHVALSFCDIEGALANLESEAPEFGFETHLAQNQTRWDDQLGRIEVKGGTPSDRTTFYTALYHATTVPNLASDVDGRYRGTDLQVHQLNPDEGDHYTVFSLWDTYRALHPLLAWIEPTRTRDMVRTMLRMYREGGQLPVWELASNYTGCMIGYHSVPVMVDALAWDIGDWDQTLALEAMVQAADSMHLGLDAYAEMGYIPSDHEHESVSKTLEYAFDDACIARMAAHLNQADVETRFRRRAAHWTNLYNPASGFIQPKRKGAWNEGFEPREVNFNFTEANAWQYLFAAQHDIQGQAALAGGDSAYLAKIDAMFNAPVQTTGRVQPDITGLRGQYAHGNEPSHHVSYLASYAGAPSQTADRVRDICKNLYNDSPAGLCGNEDCGQMSAWYVWSALGMYPVEPGSGQLVLGSPLFEQTVVRPAQGEPTTLDAPKAATRPYIDQAAWTSLNGQVSEGTSRSFITTQQLRQGGTLNLKMSDKPGDRFGVKPEDRPTSLWESPDFLAVPGIEAPRTFQSESAAFQLQHIQPDAVLSYSVDDGATWDIYNGPVAVQETTHILARATLDDLTSNTAAHTMLKVDHGWRMTLEHAPDNQYLAGGDQALIDGLEGGHDFRTGEWQGFWGAPMVARIDLGRVCNVQGIEVHALQDIKPWIWAPRHVQFSASKDGRDFDVEGRVNVNVEEDDTEVQVVTYRLDKPIRTRHLEIAAAPHASIPEWHLGRGNDRWMFLDEIRVDIQKP